MWKFLETLAVRLEMLQELQEIRPSPSQFTFDTVRNGADLVNSHVSTKERRANLDPCFPSIDVTTKRKPFPCAAENCGRAYMNADRLHDHIRSASGRGHKALKCIIDQANCFPCHRAFQKSTNLVRHEKSKHGENYNTRITSFIPYQPSASSEVHDDEIVENGATAISRSHTSSVDAAASASNQKERTLAHDQHFDFNSSSLDSPHSRTEFGKLGNDSGGRVDFDFDSAALSSAGVDFGQRSDFNFSPAHRDSLSPIATGSTMADFSMEESVGAALGPGPDFVFNARSVNSVFEGVGVAVNESSGDNGWRNVPAFDFNSIPADGTCVAASKDFFAGISADGLSQMPGFDFDCASFDPEISLN